MRIAFFCSSLEPGRDGVGDYTRRVAEECTRSGHHCFLIALNDEYSTEPVEEVISTETGSITTLRLPKTLRWSERSEAAISFRIRCRPDWISLQFVPYGYHPKGVVFGLDRHLKPVFGDHRIHIMFHELWLGGYTRASWKERVVGTLQRAAIVRLIRSIAPAFVTTSNAAYLGMLRNYVERPELLRIFGNIPVIEKPEFTWIEDEVHRTSASLGEAARNEYWLFAFFGTLHLGWPPEPFFSYVLEAAKSCRKKVVVASIGRLGPGEALFDELGSRYAGLMHFMKLGEQRPERVSALLQFANFGVAASPWELVAKSSTAASMLEHGLPVIVNGDGAHFEKLEKETPPPGLTKMDSSLPAALHSLERRCPRPSIVPIVRGFLDRLLQISDLQI
jgi:hypothetical protein